ncbi:DUF4333 domain-containing protein [Nocardioides sp. GCM10027113]|uniref:DUF4333 domain-containing protein n=1 Tax=unclassified Nocardioides TaxID=2615069 RepID=UPI00361ED3BD
MHARSHARLAVPALVLALAGCSQQVTVDEQEVERQVSSVLEEMAGQAPDDVDCPGDLEGEEDTRMRCVLAAGEDRLGLTVTVTGVDGTDVAFDVEVDDEVME